MFISWRIPPRRTWKPALKTFAPLRDEPATGNRQAAILRQCCFQSVFIFAFGSLLPLKDGSACCCSPYSCSLWLSPSPLWDKVAECFLHQFRSGRGRLPHGRHNQLVLDHDHVAVDIDRVPTGKTDRLVAGLASRPRRSRRFLGGLSSTRFSGTVLTILFSVVVAVAGMLMIRFFPTTSKPDVLGTSTISWRRRTAGRGIRCEPGLGTSDLLVAGLVSGLVGVGGGILKVPMMVLLLGIPIEIAVGSSALMVGITAAAGFAGHVANGHWDWRTSVALALAVFLGGQVGSRISIGLEKKRLQRGFRLFPDGLGVVDGATSCVGNVKRDRRGSLREPFLLIAKRTVATGFQPVLGL